MATTEHISDVSTSSAVSIDAARSKSSMDETWSSLLPLFDNVTSITSKTTFRPSSIPPLQILLGSFLFCAVFITASANLFVLLSFVYEKKLRTTFATLIANLALTDFIIAVFPMNFYTINIMFGYWPLGKILCGLWVVADYNTVFSSTYSLAAISLDRLWSIKWSIHYRQHNTKRKASIMVATIWFMVFAVAMYPTISDRILHTRDDVCEFVPSENPRFVIALALLGHHIPSIIIVVCYIIVYIEIRHLVRTRPQDKFRAVAARTKVDAAEAGSRSVDEQSNSRSVSGTNQEDDAAGKRITVGDEEQISTIELDAEAHLSGTSTKSVEDKENAEVVSGGTTANVSTVTGQSSFDESNHPKTEQKKIKSDTSTAQNGGEARSRIDRERKTFVTLSYIVIAYVMCWVPFHFCYDISFIRPEIVPQELFVGLFWITYFNSLMNPFLYAFSSPDLRKAFSTMIRCQFRHA